MRTAFTLRVLHWIHLENYTDTLHIKTEHFSWWIFFFWFQHYLLFTQVWCVMQTLESNVQDLIIILSSSSVWLSPHSLHVKRRQAQRHISTFVISEWIVASASTRVSLGVWLVISTVFLLAAQFYYHQTEQGPSGPRDQRTLQNWFSQNSQMKLSGLKLVFSWYNW